MSDPSVAAHRLADVPLFAGLPPATLADLARLTLIRHYRNGQILCSEGDPGEALYVLEAGQLRVSRLSPAGREAVLEVMEAPAALGELALLDGAPRDATVTAQGPVTVRLVPRPAFLALLRQQPAVGEGLLMTLAGMVRRANARQADLIALDVPGRLAKWLLARAARAGTAAARPAIEIGRSQGELAAELGTTRSTLNRTLKEFADLGLLTVDNERVVILNPDDLAAYATA